MILGDVSDNCIYLVFYSANIEIDNDERGVIGDFTTISDIRITKAKPE